MYLHIVTIVDILDGCSYENEVVPAILEDVQWHLKCMSTVENFSPEIKIEYQLVYCLISLSEATVNKLM